MIDIPPPQFDHIYGGPVIEEVLPASKIEMRCLVASAQACVMFAPNYPGDKCFIVLPVVGVGGVSEKTQELLRRHEIGHCNGWRH